MPSQHPVEEGSTGSIYEEATLSELVPPHPPPRAAPTISARTSFTSGSVFKHESSADYYYTSDPRDYPLPPPPSTIRSASRSTLSRDDMPGGSRRTSFPLASTSYPPAPPPSHRYSESLPSIPPQSSRAHSSHYPNSYLHPSDSRSNHNNNHHEGDLPSFSRWSPTWISGGYSDDGRGYTNRVPMKWQRPSESYFSELGGRGRWVADGELDEEGGGGSKKWDDVGGGTYQHGVGYDSGLAGGSSGKKEGRKTKDRMKRLEKEFGKDVVGGEGGRLSVKELMKKAKMEGKRDKAELAERSGVDSKGRLLVNGSKKRLVMRWFQLIGALGVGVAIISTSIFTHPKAPPPPASKPPIYFLYLLSFLSAALTVYLFLIRPCLHRSRSKRSNLSQPQAQGFVVPLLGGGQMYDPSHNNSSGCCCFGSSRKKQTFPGGRGKGAQQQQQYFQQQQPTVNLVMDATMLESLMRDQGYTSRKVESRRIGDEAAQRKKKKKKRRATKEREDRKYRRNRRGNGEDSDSSSSSSSSRVSSSSSDAWSDSPYYHPGSNLRRNLLSTPLIQSLHRAARSELKKITAWDILLTIAWSALSIGSIGWGQKCTPGSAQGWCNLYNSALAISAFTAASFLASVVFDVLDLKRSGSG